MLIFAYGHGGASASTLIVLVQLIPCILLAPLLGAFVDRRRPSTVLRVGYGLQAASLAAIAAAIGLDAPPWAVFVLAALSAISLTMTRSPQAAILPAIVRTTDELTAANAMTGWTDGAASLVGPVLVGVLTSLSGLTAAVAATSVMSLVALLLTAGVAGPAPAVPSRATRDSDGTNDNEDVGGSIWTGAGGNLVAAARNPQIRVLLTLHTFYFVVVGSLDLLCVILAVDYLHMGPGGAGFLNAAFGAGALFAVFVTAFLVGRRHLSRTLTAALSVSVIALALIGVIPKVVPALFLIASAGLAGRSSTPPGGHCCNDRLHPTRLRERSRFSSRSWISASPRASSWSALHWRSVAFGPRSWPRLSVRRLLIALLWRRLRSIDASASIPQVEIQLLRSIPMFAALPAPSLEGVARQLLPVEVPRGTVVIRQGDRGDSYYAVADGELDVREKGESCRGSPTVMASVKLPLSAIFLDRQR